LFVILCFFFSFFFFVISGLLSLCEPIRLSPFYLPKKTVIGIEKN